MKLPEINVLRLTFRLQAQESVLLPPFLGSTLRGALGTALKKVFCFVPHGECARCWFFEACPYQYIFESPNLIQKEDNHKLLRGQKEVPQPFVVIPPKPVRKFPKAEIRKPEKPINFNEDYAENHFSRGETLDFSILLMGKAAVYWAQVLVAVRLMAENGLGDNRVPFVLIEAFAHGSDGQILKVFSFDNPKISVSKISPIPLARLAESRFFSLKNKQTISKRHLKIEFQTPTRIRIGDEVNPAVTFSDLLKKITERLEFLAFLHAEVSQKIDYRPILKDAEKISLHQSELKSYCFEQFSSSQNRKTRRRVVLGETIFQNDLQTEFLLFLAAGEIVNVGSNTSYGFGKFAVNLCD